MKSVSFGVNLLQTNTNTPSKHAHYGLKAKGCSPSLIGLVRWLAYVSLQWYIVVAVVLVSTLLLEHWRESSVIWLVGKHCFFKEIKGPKDAHQYICIKLHQRKSREQHGVWPQDSWRGDIRGHLQLIALMSSVWLIIELCFECVQLTCMHLLNFAYFCWLMDARILLSSQAQNLFFIYK
jgi:hypothetical protein